MPTAAAIYTRISDDRAGLGLGVARQEADCRAFADHRGWPVVEVYVDNDVGAFSGRPRAAYRRMLDDVRAGRVDAVIAYKLDRLHRRPVELEEFIAVCEANAVALATVTGEVDLGTSSGRLIARIMGSVARHESEIKSERVRRAALGKATRGEAPGGGKRPFGYEADGVRLRPDEAVLIREAANRVLAGEPIYRVAQDFEARGVTTPTGRVWRPERLLRVLTSARVTGRRSHKGVQVADAVWPAILSADEAAAIREATSARDGGTRSTQTSYMLSGMIRCGRCGHRLVSHSQTGKARAYACRTRPGSPGCNKLSVLADPVEELVSEAVLLALDTPAVLTALREAEAPDGVIDGMADDQAMLEELARAYASRSITMGEWLAARAQIEARLLTAGERLSRTSLPEVDGVRERWPALSVPQRRAVIASVVEYVTVNPVAVRGRNRFDPDRVRLQWRSPVAGSA